jgi:hypothetical protein
MSCQALAAEGDLESLVAEYRRANALIRPGGSSSRVWATLYSEVEKVRARGARVGRMVQGRRGCDVCVRTALIYCTMVDDKLAR